MKDIVDRIDELLPFIAGAMGGAMAKKSNYGGQELPTELVQAVTWHPTEKDWKKAVELVIKEKNLSKKMAKKLRKFFKKHG